MYLIIAYINSKNMKGPTSYFTLNPTQGKKILKLDPINHPVKMVKHDARVKTTVKVYTNNSLKVSKEPLFFTPLRSRKVETVVKTRENLQRLMLIPALSRNQKYFESKRFSV